MIKTGHDLTETEIIEKYSKLTHRRGLGKEFNYKVLSLVGDLTGKKVIDVGCGYGELLEEIDAHYKCSLYGVDIIDIRLAELLKKLPGRIIIKNSDIQSNIPFPNDYFDIVFLLETLEHLKNPDKCIEEIKRIVKEDGLIVLTIPNATGYFPFYLMGSFIPTRWLRGKLLPYEHPSNTDQPIDTCYNYKEIVNIITRNNLKIEKVEGWRYFRYLQTLPLVRNIYKIIYPLIVWIMSKIKAERFAYNLIFLCSVKT
ncbi:MAG: methyltransferase domain-containing protein [Elusimicrobiota bacterium]